MSTQLRLWGNLAIFLSASAVTCVSHGQGTGSHSLLSPTDDWMAFYACDGEQRQKTFVASFIKYGKWCDTDPSENDLRYKLLPATFHKDVSLLSLPVHWDIESLSVSAEAEYIDCGIDANAVSDLVFQAHGDIDAQSVSLYFHIDHQASAHALHTCAECICTDWDQSNGGFVGRVETQVRFGAPDDPSDVFRQSAFYYELPINPSQQGYIWLDPEDTSMVFEADLQPSDPRGESKANVDICIASSSYELCTYPQTGWRYIYEYSGSEPTDFSGGFDVPKGAGREIVDRGSAALRIRYDPWTWNEAVRECNPAHQPPDPDPPPADMSISGIQLLYLVFHYSALDLDVDSDNSNDAPDYGPDRTTEEEDIEEAEPGRLVPLNADDDDNDGVIDSADPNNLFEDDFVRVVLELPTPLLELDGGARTTVMFTYDADYLRLWTVPGNHFREPIGDYVLNDGARYSPADLGLMPGGDNIVELWIEAIDNPALDEHCPADCDEGTTTLKVEIDADVQQTWGTELDDLVRLTIVGLPLVDVNIDCNEDGTPDANDDVCDDDLPGQFVCLGDDWPEVQLNASCRNANYQPQPLPGFTLAYDDEIFLLREESRDNCNPCSTNFPQRFLWNAIFGAQGQPAVRYIEPVAGGEAQLTMSAEYEQPVCAGGAPIVAEDSVYITVAGADLRTDLNQDDVIDEVDEDAEEQGAIRYICRGLNDTDFDGRPDLVAVDINAQGPHAPPEGTQTTFTLEVPSYIQVWDTPDMSTLPLEGPVITWDGPAEVPQTIYLEGVAFGEGGELRLQTVVSSAPGKLCEDILLVDVTGLEQIKFDETPVAPDGKTIIQASVDVRPVNAQVTWQLVGNTAGCVFEQSGTTEHTGGNSVAIVVGDTTGTITVRASIEEDFGSCGGSTELQLDCGTCANSGCEPGAVSADLGSADVTISLGLLEDGKSAGQLRLHAKHPHFLMAHPRGLEFNLTHPDVEEIHQGHQIRQIKAPEVLVDVDYSSEYDHHYLLRLYRPDVVGAFAGGVYTVQPADAFAEWKVHQPDSLVDELVLSRLHDSVVVKGHRYAYDEDAGTWTWTLYSGDGTSVLNTATEDFSAGGLERVFVATGEYGDTAHVQETYALINNKEVLTKRAVDPSGLNLVTEYKYYTTGPAMGNIRYVKTPDESETFYEYDMSARVSTVYTNWEDNEVTEAPVAANLRVTSHDYTVVDTLNEEVPPIDPRRPRTVTEAVLGQTISKTYYSYYYDDATGARVEIVERCVDLTAPFGAGTNLRTVTTYTLEDEDKIASVTYPDGRLDTYLYEDGTFNEDSVNPIFEADTPDTPHRRTIITHGTTSSPAGVDLKSTQETVVRTKAGRTVLTETYVYDYDDGAGTDTYTRIDWTMHERVYDGSERTENTYHANGTQSVAEYDCCHLSSRTDETGIETSFDHDVLGRLHGTTRLGVADDGQYAEQTPITTTILRDAPGGDIRRVTTSITGGTNSIISVQDSDLAGRATRTVDPTGLETLYDYGTDPAQRTTTVTHPDGSQTITERYRDGRVKRVSGTAVIEQDYDYDIATIQLDGEDVVVETTTRTVTATDQSATRQTQTSRDGLGRTRTEAWPAYPNGTLTTFREYFYDDVGRLSRATQPGLADVLYEYDALGNVSATGLDVNNNGALDRSSTDRIYESDIVFEQASGDWWRVATNAIYAADNDATATTVGVTRERLSGFQNVPGPPGDYLAIAHVLTADIAGNATTGALFVDAANKLAQQIVTYPDSTTDAITIVRNGLTQSTQSKSGASVQFTYDEFGRQTRIDGPRTGVWQETLYGDGQLEHLARVWRIKTSGGATGSTLAAEYSYYENAELGAGRVAAVMNADSKFTRYAYNERGQITHVWGDVPQPMKATYDIFGALWKLHTYRDDLGWTDPAWPTAAGDGDITTWVRDPSTGLLTQKLYGAPDCADCDGTSYGYTADGRLHTRTWSRTHDGSNPIVTTYGYHPETGALSSVAHNDGTTPGTTFTYKRFGGADVVTHGTNTHTYTYTDQLQLDSEALTGSLYPQPLEISWLYQSDNPPSELPGRFAGLTVDDDGTEIYAASYGYDGFGRLAHVSGPGLPTGNPAAGVWYVRDAASDLIHQLQFRDTSGVAQLWIDRTYEDDRDVLAGTQAIWGAVTAPAPDPNDPNTLSMYRYAHSDIGLRDSVINNGVAFHDPTSNVWHTSWQYNPRHELEFSDRYQGGDTQQHGPPVLDEAFRYTFDPMGNRITYTGGQQPQATYTANTLNQYTQSNLPTTPTPLIQSYEYDEDGNLQHAWLTGDMNCDGSADFDDINAFVDAVSFPETYEQEYPHCDRMNGDIDGDGDVTFGDINAFVDLLTGSGNAGPSFTYTWDAENRLTAFEPTFPDLVSGASQLKFEYDYLGRRVQKRVYLYDQVGEQWRSDPCTKVRYVWAGWQLLVEEIEELCAVPNNVVRRTYSWGLDVSGTLGGAGGIGGLLGVHEWRSYYEPPTPQEQDHVYIHDGSGNVVQIVDLGAADAASAISAHYEYDSFGARVNAGPDDYYQPFRFSTKLHDEESGLTYFGYRYYNAGLGRWLNRDPLLEEGGLNLYSYASNAPSVRIDPYGLQDEGCCGIVESLQSVLSRYLTYDGLLGQTGVYGEAPDPTWAPVDDAFRLTAAAAVTAEPYVAPVADAVELVGGASEMAGALVFVEVSGGTGAPVAAVFLVHGADHVQAPARRLARRAENWMFGENPGVNDRASINAITTELASVMTNMGFTSDQVALTDLGLGLASVPVSLVGFAELPVSMGSHAPRVTLTRSQRCCLSSNRSRISDPSRLLSAPAYKEYARSPIVSYVTDADEVVFRMFSGNSTRGGFFTRTLPRSQAEAIEGLSLPPSNKADFVQPVLIRAGTRLQSSRAFPAFGQKGGFEQLELIWPRTLPDECFGPGTPWSKLPQ